MSWILVLLHSCNPLLMLVYTKQLENDEKERGKLAECMGGLIFGLMAYAFWSLAHLVVSNMNGKEFDWGVFAGIGQGVRFFLPFVIGLIILVDGIFVRPLLADYPRAKEARGLLLSISLFAGVFTMLVNYLHWLKH